FRVSERVIRISGYGLIETLGSFLLVLRPTLVPVKAPLEQELISCRVRRLWLGELPLLASAQAQAQLLGNLSGNLRLQRQQVGRLPVVLLAPKLRVVVR